ncbi:MAG: ROK family protein [Clostridia bacterium]|nr:ROK family protein [Clostridia bacterium]
MILGIDIGGTNIKFGVVTEDYQLVKSWSIPTLSHRDIAEIIDDMIEKARKIRTEYHFDRIGIGTPGDIDSERGICLRAANLPYKQTPLAAIIRDALKVPTCITNDATAALYGELYAGAGKAYQNIILLTLGTGVGGGIAINGKPYLGSKGYGGELGHMIIHYDGLPCPCGLRGCYEQYASVTALVRQIKEAISAHPDSLLAKIGGESPSARDVFCAKEQGCPIATAVLEQYTRYIAIGINSYEAIFQPEAFIIGGAISQQGENLLAPIREKMHKPNILLVSSLKNDAGMIGAAVVATVFPQ